MVGVLVPCLGQAECECWTTLLQEAPPGGSSTRCSAAHMCRPLGLLVSKGHARHYFHRLRIGRRWRWWLCRPPFSWRLSASSSGQRFPASCSAPMGFGPSACWAQALTDVVTADAGLPFQQRVHPDTVSDRHRACVGSGATSGGADYCSVY